VIDPLVAALKQRREELGWEPIKLTREFNWSSAALIRFEAGGDPRLSTVRKVAEALGGDLAFVTAADKERYDEQTLFKVDTALRRAGLSDPQRTNAIIQMQNGGILFRERAIDERPVSSC